MEKQLSKYGEILYVKTTEEPALVLKQFKHLSLVRRPIMGRDGIRYKFAFLLNSELETLAEQTTRTLSTIQARNSIAESQFGTNPDMPALSFKKSN